MCKDIDSDRKGYLIGVLRDLEPKVTQGQSDQLGDHTEVPVQGNKTDIP